MSTDLGSFAKRILAVTGFAVLALGCVPAVHAAEWQWSVTVNPVTSKETNKPPRAFLWIPPTCKQVRGVVVGQHNMEEEGILEHAAFRQAMGEIGFAEVWVSPCLDRTFDFTHGAGENFEAMMKALAAESGYRELANAPVVPIGHSACASFPWNFAAWNPGRTLAAISVSGQWPLFSDREKDTEQPALGNRTFDGVPGLVTMGEYEWAENRFADGAKLRSRHPQWPLTALGEPGAGHFDFSDRKVAYIAAYIRTAAKYRLPAVSPLDGPVEMTPIDPTKQGWLFERVHMAKGPSTPAAPVGQYKGKPEDAFWIFDGELAKETEALGAGEKGKKVQLLGYRQKDGITPQTNGLHAQVRLKFEPIDDGLTFKLRGDFLDTVPEGRPEKWVGQPKDSVVAHGADPEHIRISRICGPVQQLAPDTFAIRFYRMGMDNPRRSNDIWLLAEHPGDATYRRIIQQSQMGIPLTNKQGADQTITFPAIPDQKTGVKTIPLQATSSLPGSKVHYYVLAGPAEVVDDDHLVITPVPPRSRSPITVTVVAWQWGRSINPQVKTAIPVERNFTISK